MCWDGGGGGGVRSSVCNLNPTSGSGLIPSESSLM